MYHRIHNIIRKHKIKVPRYIYCIAKALFGSRKTVGKMIKIVDKIIFLFGWDAK